MAASSTGDTDPVSIGDRPVLQISAAYPLPTFIHLPVVVPRFITLMREVKTLVERVDNCFARGVVELDCVELMLSPPLGFLSRLPLPDEVTALELGSNLDI